MILGACSITAAVIAVIGTLPAFLWVRALSQPSDAQFGTVRVPFVRHRLLHLQVAGPTSSQHLGARWITATVVVALVKFVLLSDIYEFFFCWFSLLVFHSSCSFVGACLVWPHPTAYLLISRLILGHFQSFFASILIGSLRVQFRCLFLSGRPFCNRFLKNPADFREESGLKLVSPVSGALVNTTLSLVFHTTSSIFIFSHIYSAFIF